MANFNELIQAGSGDIVITKTSGNVVFATIPVGNPQVTISGTSLTINPTADLEIGQNYYVTIAAGAIKDIAGNNFAGITSNATWTFTTDGNAPTAATFSPIAGATGIAPVSSLTINFSEEINPVPGKFITLRKAGGALVETREASVFDGVSATGPIATITLANPLEYGVSYYVQIDAGAFEDNSGNTYAGIADTTTWTFTTVNVPSLTGTPYTQTFSSYVSAGTLPSGWSFSGGPLLDSTYRGTWGTVTPDPGNPAATLGGFLGNASVFGYHHTSLSNTTNVPGLTQTLTLRNGTGATLTALSIAYKGRVNVPANTRIPVFTVTVAGTPVTALGYSTADGDNAQRNASLTGLSIADGATFQINWTSFYPAGAGSARQIGISDVSVSAANTLYAPTVTSLSVPVGTIGALSAPAQASVIGDGGQTVTARGFVYSVTSVNAAPQLGGTGVTSIADGSPEVGAFSATLTGLTANTSYSVSAYATNATGTSYTAVTTFTSLALPPSFTGSYAQEFSGITGDAGGVTNIPAGWTAVSDAVPPVQTYVGTWGTTSSSGGFLGGVTATPPTVPGVLGYRHTASSGTLTVTLRLVNGTGAPLTSLNVSYLGRVERITEGRSPIWTVAVNGGTPVVALSYDTTGNVDATKSATVTGLNIPAGGEFNITWKSDRGAGSGSAKQVGIAQVAITTPGGGGNTYASWKAANAGGEGPTSDFDKDGVSNGVEYFFGATGSFFTPTPQLVGNKVSYPKDASATSATGIIETSPDLVVWSPVASDTSVPGFISYQLLPGQGKIFVRLNVVVTP